MKLLLFLLAVLAGVWLWQGNRRRARARNPANPAATPQSARAPEDMVRCVRCGVHLPRVEALSGPGGLYCCAEHRDRGGR